jgi:transcriptional regulator with XRE-family HTH domain
VERTKGAQYRELGAVLRDRREQAGLTVAEMAPLMGFSTAKLSRIETGQTVIDVVDAVTYLGHCGLWRADVMDILALCREANRDLGFWLSPHGELLEDSLNSLIYHEMTAAASTTYEPQLVPGLLQTTDYARTCIAAERWRSLASVDHCLRIRLERQRVLNGRGSATFVFFLHEQALHVEVGSSAIMHEQMLNLVLLTALPHVIVRVVPWSAGERSAFGQAFRLFEYTQYPPLVYLDTYKTGLFLEDKEFVDPFRNLVPAISEVALDEGQSRALIASLASKYDQGSERDADDRLEEEQL